MKRILLIILAVVAVGAVAYAGYSYYAGIQANADTPGDIVEESPSLLQQDVDDVIWASGKLLPTTWAYLGFEQGGRLMDLAVGQGDQAAEGQLLATVDATELEAAVTQAQAALNASQSELARVQAPSRPEQIASAEAAVQAARAQLESANAALATAKSRVDAVKSEVSVAQASYDQVRAGTRSEVVAAAKERLDQAQSVRDQAQAAYDQVSGNPNIGMMPQSVTLQQATAAFKAAQAEYSAAVRGATPEELTIALNQVGAAQSQVGVAETEVGNVQAQIASAEAAILQAQAQLDLLKAGARDEDVAVAQAAVAQAGAAFEAAQAALSKTQLQAPFDGTVAAVWSRPGEVVSPAQEVLAIGQLDSLRIETTDLRETDVSRVEIGQEVEVTFDALPNQVFTGVVTRIAPMSTQEQGSVNYTAIIELNELDPTLRWGMTAFVNIETK
ncbi:MAG: efflux RND transporter periplasmic adaptor subunit [Chloroflexota bacterium]|nr:efflux RND transporter periplasmic adaptor subunit [Chloroflexota bacterium]